MRREYLHLIERVWKGNYGIVEKRYLAVATKTLQKKKLDNYPKKKGVGGEGGVKRPKNLWDNWGLPRVAF